MTTEASLIDAKTPDRLRVCLAASGGGHVRQVLDLEAAWLQHDYFFATESTALGKSLADKHPTAFLPHTAVGQIRTQSVWKFASSILRNIAESSRIVRRHKPDVVISTGAGAVFFVLLFAKLRGAKTFAIESFARFEGPSLFFRAASRLADVRIIQSQKLSDRFPDAFVFDPLVISDKAAPEKKPLIFATVGATLPFDRLTQMVATAKSSGVLDEQVILQVGEGGVRPNGVESFETLPFPTVREILREASIVVCHGGTGSIITALQNGCHVIAVPRQASLGEHYDDHQQEITGTFRDRGLIEVANTPEEFADAVRRLQNRKRIVATTDHAALSEFLIGRLSDIRKAKTNAN